MRNYELICGFRIREGQVSDGIAETKKILNDNNMASKSENDMGERDLAFMIDKESRAGFHLFNVEAEPEDLNTVQELLKLRKEILRFLFVRAGQH